MTNLETTVFSYETFAVEKVAKANSKATMTVKPGGVKEMLMEQARLAREKRLAQVEADRKAREARAAAEMAREQKAQQQLQELKKRWEEADKVVEIKRQEAFKKANEVVNVWKVEREKCIKNCDAAAAAHEKKMAEAWHVKEVRMEQHKQECEAEVARRALALQARQGSAGAKFQEALQARNDRLEDAQRKAEERRLAKAEEKRVQLERMRVEAERRLEESWKARVRVREEREKYAREVELDCERKAKQAEACIKARKEQIAAKEDAWRTAMQSAANAT